LAKYLVETYGCQMNQHDSERMAGLLEQAGYERTDDDRDADVIVINTCSVREKAEEKLYTRLGEIRMMGVQPLAPSLQPPASDLLTPPHAST
jgi:tRNA-2-methylthio-N6-dimethylallyladenosine synthase